MRLGNSYSGVRFFCTWFFLWGKVLLAQASVPHLVPNFSVYPFFNTAYIQSHKVKTIRTEVMYKYPMKSLIGTIKKQEYGFHRNGLPDWYKWTSASGMVHTSRYTYNSRNELICEVEDSESVFYQYDSQGFVLMERKVHTNGTSDTQTYRMEQTAHNQWKRYWLNNEQLTYKYQIQHWDESGKMTQATTRFIRGPYKEVESWKWDHIWLTEYEHEKQEFNSLHERFVISYDAQKRVQKMMVFTNEENAENWEYLYENGMLTAILAKDLSNNCITITKLSYTYWP